MYFLLMLPLLEHWNSLKLFGYLQMGTSRVLFILSQTYKVPSESHIKRGSFFSLTIKIAQCDYLAGSCLDCSLSERNPTLSVLFWSVWFMQAVYC